MGPEFIVTDEVLNDPTNRLTVRQRLQFEPIIEIIGKLSASIDLNLFEEISRICEDSVTSLVLKNMELPIDIDSITIFRKLENLSLNGCTLSFSVMELERWCPNLISLKINALDFGADSWHNEWRTLATSHKSPTVKSLHFVFNRTLNHNVYGYLEAMEKQFPSLENLLLEFDSNVNFLYREQQLSDSFGSDTNEYEYEPLYFVELKKLKIFAFGECNNIFNCLAISNDKVNTIEFCGMMADGTLIESICNYSMLRNLTLDCPYVSENYLERLAVLPRLTTLILDVKDFDWHPTEMMALIQRAQTLRQLIIQVERTNDEYTIDEEFFQQFRTLIANDRQFKLNIEFYQSRKEIRFLQNGNVDLSRWNEM